MSDVFFSEVAVDQNIINVRSAKNVQVVSQSVIDVVLKQRQCISKTKRHDKVFIELIMCSKGSFSLFSFSYS